MLTPEVWITELYSPSTLAGLLDGLSKLEAKKTRRFPQQEAASDWVRAARRSGGWSSYNLGFILPEGSKLFIPESITDLVPRGVEFVHLQLSTLTATVTALTAAFRFDDTRGAALNRILQDDFVTRHEPIKGGGWRIRDVRGQKRSAVSEHRAALRCDACRWLAERLPGSFDRLAPGQLPTIELLLTEQLRPWDPASGGRPPEWVQLIELDGELMGYWQAANWEAANIADLRFAERHLWSSGGRERHVAVLAARKADVLAAFAPGMGPSHDLWEALGDLEESVPPLAARWALAAYTREIEAHLNSVSDATDRATRQRSASALIELRNQLIRTALDGGVLVNGIADFADDVRIWTHGVPDFRQVLPPRLSDRTSPETSLVEGLRTQVCDARRLTKVETNLRELIFASAGLTAGAENLRLQRRIIVLTLLSLFFAAIAAVASVVAVRDSGPPPRQAPIATTTTGP